MTPSIGRIVHYVLSDSDAASINKRRQDAAASNVSAGNTGVVVHAGNHATGGDVYPLIITRVWATGDAATEQTACNGQVMLDGNDTLWVTSVSQGDGQREWFEAPRV